ncbi:MAG: hypothetical protein JNM70_08990 [Anaerolineae bacterium]|nr:hypothetical protein [Anaerolineae bacterium]
MRQLTIERSAILILFGLLFALATRVPIDTDTWWHLRAGEYTLTQGMIHTDPFSFTKAGAAWTNHSWLSQVVMTFAWQLGGNFGLAIYTSVLATVGMVFVYQMSSGSAYLRAFAIVLGAATAAVFWSPRPQMFSFALSAALLYVLVRFRREERDWLWGIPPLMAVWGNLHAGFSIGFILLFGTIAGKTIQRILNPTAPQTLSWAKIRKLVLVTVVSIAALVINPYGLQMLSVPFQTVSIGALQDFIQEWNSPNFHERQVWPFVALLLGLLGAAGASRKRLSWTDFILAAGTAFMALLAGRNIAVFAVVATPILTVHLDDVLAERGWTVRPVQRVTARMARLNAILVAVVLLGCLAKVVLVLDAETVEEGQREFLPVQVAEYLKAANPPGLMFNSYNWGGYLMFALPDRLVFIDGRTDLYGDAFISQEYFEAARGSSGWEAILDRYDIWLVVVEAESGLARVLRDQSGWTLDYEDDLAVVFTRAGAGS